MLICKLSMAIDKNDVCDQIRLRGTYPQSKPFSMDKMNSQLMVFPPNSATHTNVCERFKLGTVLWEGGNVLRVGKFFSWGGRDPLTHLTRIIICCWGKNGPRWYNRIGLYDIPTTHLMESIFLEMAGGEVRGWWLTWVSKGFFFFLWLQVLECVYRQHVICWRDWWNDQRTVGAGGVGGIWRKLVRFCVLRKKNGPACWWWLLFPFPLVFFFKHCYWTNTWDWFSKWMVMANFVVVLRKWFGLRIIMMDDNDKLQKNYHIQIGTHY